ncbi:MAG: methylated-DNA--[Christensenellaceae bacterium]|nr:methylated-DNA--[protein]-cysteine S-methyltransferase [Christensenellaceae bacterium]
MIGYYASPIGTLLIREKDGVVLRIVRISEDVPQTEENDTLRGIKKELDRFFAGKSKAFQFAIAPEGTDFQKKIWAELQKIPYGQTASYKEIAERACGSARYARAAASAAHRNPILLAIPCHRMIAADGSLGGFAAGNDAKEYLLGLERKTENRK